MTYLSPVWSFHTNLWRRIDAHFTERWLEMERVTQRSSMKIHGMMKEKKLELLRRWRNGFGVEFTKTSTGWRRRENWGPFHRKKSLEMIRISQRSPMKIHGMMKLMWIIEKMKIWVWCGITRTSEGWRRRGGVGSVRGGLICLFGGSGDLNIRPKKGGLSAYMEPF